jgi:hypothetical protein
MHPVMIYLLKMVGYSAVLVFYYFLFLRDKQYHHYNRYYLLLSVILSLLLPLVEIPVSWDGPSSDVPLYLQTLEAISIEKARPYDIPGDVFDGQRSFFAGSLVITIILLIVMSNSIRKVLKICRQYTSLKLNDISFYNTEEKEAPFHSLKTYSGIIR